jgi:N-acetylmuramoyl-L-alanine amidase
MVKFLKFFAILFFLTINLYAQSQNQNAVDIDSIARKFKLEVSYNDLSGDVILSDKQNQIKIVPGSSYYEINQKIYGLPRPISMVNGQIYIDRRVLDNLTRLRNTPEKVDERIIRVLPKNFTIVLDPGHGGKDPGTCGAKGTEEKKVALTVSLLLKEELENMGARVLMTRSSDVFIPLPERPLLASISNADLFVSLHLNSSKDSGSEGVETFVYRYRDQKYENSRSSVINQNISFKKSLLADDCFMNMGIENDIMRLQLFGNVEDSNKLASSVQKSFLQLGEITDRGVKDANFAVLRNATCPSILVEMGFLSHAQTEDKFLTNSYCKQVAVKIADGIAKFWKEK